MDEQVYVRKGIFTKTADGMVLSANRCRSCGQLYFPEMRPPCPNCFHEELEKVALSRRGKLFTYTVVHMPSLHFQPPYAVGYVELPEKIKIFTPLEMVEDTTFEVGMEMELQVEALWVEEEKEIVGYRFKPLGG